MFADEKQYIVVVNGSPYSGRQRAKQKAAIARRNKRAIGAFKKELAGLLERKRLPADAVTFLNATENADSVLVRCSAAVADNLKGLQGVASVVAVQIPVIDFGPCFAGKPGALERVAGLLRQACEKFGVFYALNHGVPEDLIEVAFAASRRFHALPIEKKLKLKLNEDKIGYLQIRSSLRDAPTAAPSNFNESFFIGHDRGADHPDVVAGTALLGRNQWPEGVPGLREDMMAYFHALGAMCDRMLPAFALALDMPSDFFAPFFAHEPQAKVRFLHYPPQPADADNLVGLAQHTDFSFMAALARTNVPGLSIRLPSGEWYAPPIVPGTFLINVGHTLQRWSNDRFPAVLHGVLNDSGVDRYSISYFHSPNLNQVIACLPSCVGADNPAHYLPAQHRDLWLAFYGRK